MYIDFATGMAASPYIINHPVPVFGGERFKDSDESALRGKLYQCPLRIKWEDEAEWWTLPFDPVLSVSGGNTLVRSSVQKYDDSRTERRGTVKEVWCSNDYEIQIAGVFIASESDDLPTEDMERLRAYCESPKVVEVENDLLEVFNITRIAIETYQFAHTPGRQNQQFTIKAYSDDDFELIVE